MLTKERTLWVDSCRFFAIFVIMCTHFLAGFFPDTLRLWEEGLSSWLLYGLTGKFSVAFFFVLLGYFASRSASFSPGGFLRYSVKRYIHFAFFVFVSTLIYIVACYGCTWLFHRPGDDALRVISDGFRYNFIYLIRDSFLFEDNYNATLWCLQQLFIASLVCRALGYLPKKMGAAAAVFVIAVLMIIDPAYCVWICAAVLGNILRLVNELRLKVSRAVIIAALLLTLLLIKIRLPEGALQYSMQAVAAWLLIFAQFHLTGAQNLLSSRPFPWLGEISMGLFVVHTPINAVLASSLFPLLVGMMPQTVVGIICFILSTALSIVCAWILHKMYRFIAK